MMGRQGQIPGEGMLTLQPTTTGGKEARLSKAVKLTARALQRRRRQRESR